MADDQLHNGRKAGTIPGITSRLILQEEVLARQGLKDVLTP
jgi:hypothetical protein